jgi:hypothetical protein
MQLVNLWGLTLLKKLALARGHLWTYLQLMMGLVLNAILLLSVAESSPEELGGHPAENPNP